MNMSDTSSNNPDSIPPSKTSQDAVDAVYQDGSLKLSKALDIPNDAQVQITIVPQSEGGDPRPTEQHASEPPAQTSPEANTGSMRGLLLLLAGALGLIGLAQQTFLDRLEFSWTGTGLAVVAILIFTVTAFAANNEYKMPAFLQNLFQSAGRGSWQQVMLIGSVILIGILLYLLQLEPALPSYNWTLLLWLGATALYVAAIAPPHKPAEQRWNVRTWWQQHNQTIVAIGAILIVAVGLRLFQLESIPPTLGGDEAEQGLEAIDVLNGDITNPFSTGWLGVPTMSFYFNALTIGPLGNTIFALRLPWVFVGAATVLTTFLLVRRLRGETLALLTAALLATYHYHIHYSRLGSNQIADALFVSAALLFFYRGYDTRQPVDWALSGIIVGFAQYFYAGGRFTAVIIIALIAYFTLRDRQHFWREHYRGVLVLLGAMVLVSGPMIQYAFRFPDDYNARLSMVGIFQSGWLATEQEVLGQSAWEILVVQFQRAALAFTAYPDKTFWYGSSKPLFHFADGALFLLGIGFASISFFNRRLIPMVFWWWGGMVMGGFLTENPPSTQRLVTMSVPAVFFVALALEQIGLIVQRSWNRPAIHRFITPALGGAVLILSLLSIRWYFVEYTPQRIYGGINSVVATSIAEYARDDLDENWHMYFFGPPRMYIGFGTIPYLAPDVAGEDILEPMTEPLNPSTIQTNKNAAFIFLPERMEELERVRTTFPNGELEPIPSPIDSNETLYTVYRVPQSQIAQGVE